MATFRYVVADVFTDTPLDGQPARGLHGRPRAPRETTPGARARDELLRDDVRLPAGGRRPRADADLHAVARAALRRASDARDRVRARRRRCSSIEIRIETRRASCRCSSSAKAHGSPSGGWRSRCRRSRPFERADELLAALGVDGRELPVELYDNGVAARLRRARVARRGRCAAAGHAAPRRRSRATDQLLRRRGHALEDADVRARRSASPRILRPVRQPARSRCTSSGTGGSTTARRSRSSRARRSAGRRSSTRASTGSASRRANRGRRQAVVVARGEFRL